MGLLNELSHAKPVPGRPIAQITAGLYAATIYDRKLGKLGAAPDDVARGIAKGGQLGLRALAEQSTHRVIVRRRLPSPFYAARIYASPEGGLRYLRPRMDKVDPILLGLAAEVVQPSEVVWDIGANLGLFSLAAAVTAGADGYVLAIEPDVVMVSLLRRSAAANCAHAEISVLPAAVADQIGVARFHVARRNRSTSYLDGFGTSQTGGIRATTLVPTVTLDWLADHFPSPGVVKIDVEGAEVDVLAGARRILSRQPTIICEVAGNNATAVADILSKFRYTLYDGDQPPAKRIPLSVAPPNTLAIAQTPERPRSSALQTTSTKSSR